ncbi:MAG: two-component system, OmpR family, response regulator MtrA [Thermomicrobiales bacterium]|nr:two-component system, OmpR family, response regulator MtrA [Thermomicrobiales bacterium]
MEINTDNKVIWDPMAEWRSAGIGDAAGREETTVLVVEDDPTLLSTLSYSLSRSGYRVLLAADGETALATARREGMRLDLVLLDVMLPGINGLQVLRQLRVDSDVPVLMLSARGEVQDKIDGLELGADDYVVKPFALRELLARVRAAVRRRAVPAARPPAVLFRGPLRIEPDRRRALAGDRELQLRPKEFGLLLTLAMEPGRVFGRQELLDEVWGEEIIVDERTVDVHISWLRGKLHDAGIREEMIKTVYGSGYRSVVPPEAAEGAVGSFVVGGEAS